MGRVLIETSSLSAIGDAIRAKTGKTSLISPAQMVTEIGGIANGSSTAAVALGSVTATEAGRLSVSGLGFKPTSVYVYAALDSYKDIGTDHVVCIEGGRRTKFIATYAAVGTNPDGSTYEVYRLVPRDDAVTLTVTDGGFELASDGAAGNRVYFYTSAAYFYIAAYDTSVSSEENEAGGVTYDITTQNYDATENDFGGTTYDIAAESRTHKL